MQKRTTSIVAALLLTGTSFANAEENVEEIVISATPLEQDEFSILSSVNVVDGEELERNLDGTIGETLSSLPGVSSTYFGPAASRPVIRGLGSSRVQVLTDGIGTIDASVTSPDHAVAGDPITAQSIEVVRGPATLLYGSAATGGVINIIDHRIPKRMIDEPTQAALRGIYGTNADEFSAEGAFDMALGKSVLHFDGFYRQTDNFEIPGFAESEALRHMEEEGGEEHEEIRDVMENSDSESKGFTFGASTIFDGGHFGFSVNSTEKEYGLPGGHAHHEEEEPHAGEEEEAHVRIELEQRRYDLSGEWSGDLHWFNKIKLRAGYGDYEHRELEGAAIGTTFTNEGYELRTEVTQASRGPLEGAFGFQMSKRDFSAIGEEAFVPPSETLNTGLFIFEQLNFEPWRFEFAGRIERQSSEVTALATERSFTPKSASLGLAYQPNPDLLFGLSVYRSERAPAPEELFSNGPHLATNAYELGDTGLSTEKALGAEAFFRGSLERVDFALSLFVTDYSDFIYERETGAEIDHLPVFAFTQTDVKFRGMEFETSFELGATGDFTWSLDWSAEYVEADISGTAEELPRIPPLGIHGAIAAESENLRIEVELEAVGQQKDVAPYELPTNSHTLLGSTISWRPFGDAQDVTIMLQGRNLLDEEARNHVSFLKDVLPLPGRDIRLSVTTRF